MHQREPKPKALNPRARQRDEETDRHRGKQGVRRETKLKERQSESSTIAAPVGACARTHVTRVTAALAEPVPLGIFPNKLSPMQGVHPHTLPCCKYSRRERTQRAVCSSLLTSCIPPASSPRSDAAISSRISVRWPLVASHVGPPPAPKKLRAARGPQSVSGARDASSSSAGGAIAPVPDACILNTVTSSGGGKEEWSDSRDLLRLRNADLRRHELRPLAPPR